MNKLECKLAFLVEKEVILAEHASEKITQTSFVSLEEQIKAECKGTCSNSFLYFNLIFLVIV
jgi:hypothetical protein